MTTTTLTRPAEPRATTPDLADLIQQSDDLERSVAELLERKERFYDQAAAVCAWIRLQPKTPAPVDRAADPLESQRVRATRLLQRGNVCELTAIALAKQRVKVEAAIARLEALAATNADPFAEGATR